MWIHSYTISEPCPFLLSLHSGFMLSAQQHDWCVTWTTSPSLPVQHLTANLHSPSGICTLRQPNMACWKIPLFMTWCSQKKNIKKRSFVRGFPISMFEYPKEGDKLEHSPSIELSPKPLHLLHKCLGLCQGNQFILLSMQDEGRKRQTPHLTSADNRWFDQRKLVIWPVGFLASNRNGNNGWGSGITPWNHGTNGTHVMTMITVGKSFSKTQRVGGVRECSQSLFNVQPIWLKCHSSTQHSWWF